MSQSPPSAAVTAATDPDVGERLALVRERIAEGCLRVGRADTVRLVAVCKKQPLDRVRAAYAAGARDFGENYPNEMFDRFRQWAQPDVQWHFLGRITRRTLPRIAAVASWLHGLYEPEHIDKLAAMARAGSRVPRLLLQVNIGGEEQKQGAAPADAAGLIRRGGDAGVRFEGVMTIGPVRQSRDEVRGDFETLRILRDRLAAETGVPLPELSMGMSGDYEIAVEEGATMVRVGEAIFGPRPTKT